VKVKILISVLSFILLSSCNSYSSSPMVISAQNVINLSPIKEWKLYDVIAIAWSPNSSDFAIAGLAGSSNDDANSPTLFVYNIDDPKMKWSTHAYGGLSLTYRPDGKVIAVPALLGGASLFDATTGQEIEEIVDPVMEKGQCIGRVRIAYSPNDTKIFTMDSDFAPGQEATTIFIWDAIKKQCIGTLINEQGSSFNFELSRDGQFLALLLRDVQTSNNASVFQVQIWNVETQKQICSFTGGNAAIDPNGNFIAIADVSNNGDVNIWDIKSCKFLYALGRKGSDRSYLMSMAVSPDGQLLAIGGANSSNGQLDPTGTPNTIQIWQLSNRKLLFMSDLLPNWAKILTFSPNGNYLLSEMDRISYTGNTTITLWGIK
jgi:WD40 repeat protein